MPFPRSSPSCSFLSATVRRTALLQVLWCTQLLTGWCILPKLCLVATSFLTTRTTGNTGPVSAGFGTKTSTTTEANLTPVKPQGRRPWFVSASVWLADRMRHGSESKKRDAASIDSMDSRWGHQDRVVSYGSSRELQAVAAHPPLTNPRQDKVLTKQ